MSSQKTENEKMVTGRRSNCWRGLFFIGAGRKEDRAINATDNTPGSTRAGMIGQRPVYSDLVYQLYVHSLFTDIVRSKSQRIEIMVTMLW